LSYSPAATRLHCLSWLEVEYSTIAPGMQTPSPIRTRLADQFRILPTKRPR